MSFDKHVWPSFDPNGDMAKSAQQAIDEFNANLRTPGDKAASALLGPGGDLIGAYDDALLDALEHGTGFMKVSADGVKHIPIAEVLNDYTGLPGIKEITPEMEAEDRAAINKWLVSCITSAPADSGLHTMTALEIKAIAFNFLINTRKDVVVGPTEENSLARWY